MLRHQLDEVARVVCRQRLGQHDLVDRSFAQPLRELRRTGEGAERHPPPAGALNLAERVVADLADHQNQRLAPPAGHEPALERGGREQQHRRDKKEDADQRAVQRRLGGDQDQRHGRQAPGLGEDQPARQLRARPGDDVNAVNPQPLGGEHPDRQKDHQQMDVFAGRQRRFQRRQEVRRTDVGQPGQQERADDQRDVLHEQQRLERFVPRHAAVSGDASIATIIPASSQKRA